MKLSQGHCERGHVVNPETDRCLTIGSKKYRKLTQTENHANHKELPRVAKQTQGNSQQTAYAYYTGAYPPGMPPGMSAANKHDLNKLRKQQQEQQAKQAKQNKNMALRKLFGKYAPENNKTWTNVVKKHYMGHTPTLGAAGFGAYYGYSAAQAAALAAGAALAPGAALTAALAGTAIPVGATLVRPMWNVTKHVYHKTAKSIGHVTGTKLVSRKNWTTQMRVAENTLVGLQREVDALKLQKTKNDESKEALQRKYNKLHRDLQSNTGFNYNKHTNRLNTCRKELENARSTHGSTAHVQNAAAKIKHLENKLKNLESASHTMTAVKKRLDALEKLDALRDQALQHIVGPADETWESQGHFLKLSISQLRDIPHADLQAFDTAFEKAIRIRKTYESQIQRANAFKNLIELVSLPTTQNDAYRAKFNAIRMRLPENLNVVQRLWRRRNYTNDIEGALERHARNSKEQLERVKQQYTNKLVQSDVELDEYRQGLAARNQAIAERNRRLTDQYALIQALQSQVNSQRS